MKVRNELSNVRGNTKTIAIPILPYLVVTKKFCELNEGNVRIAEKAQETRPGMLGSSPGSPPCASNYCEW